MKSTSTSRSTMTSPKIFVTLRALTEQEVFAVPSVRTQKTLRYITNACVDGDLISGKRLMSDSSPGQRAPSRSAPTGTGAIGKVPQGAWTIAISPKGEARERRAGGACPNARCAHGVRRPQVHGLETRRRCTGRRWRCGSATYVGLPQLVKPFMITVGSRVEAFHAPMP